ncbi:MAG: hypothetical protein WBL31_14045 [Ilumatobacteraceae bacterium]
MSKAWLVHLLVGAALLSACAGNQRLPAGVGPAPLESSPSISSANPAPTDTTTPDAVTGDTVDTSDPAPTDSSPVEPDAAAVAPGCAAFSVPTGSTEIAGERCDPDPLFAGPRPAVLVLNGCGGYLADAEIGRDLATALTREGIVAIRIDYLGAAPDVAFCDLTPDGLSEVAQPILEAVADTVAVVRLDPNISSIGAVGYSLGAATAMSAVFGGAGLATIEPVPFSAVALLSYPNVIPGVTDGIAAGLGPPLFVMSGEDDDVAPPADSTAIVETALAAGNAVEQLLVPGQGHSWTGPAASLAAATLADELADRLLG